MNPRYDNSPYFLSVLDLKRSAGAEKKVEHEFELEDNFDDGMQGITAGTKVVLDVTLESVIDGIYLSGVLSTTVFKTCARCAKSVTDTIKLPLQAFYFYNNKVEDDDIDMSEDSYNLIEDHYIDLVQLTRDAVFDSFDFTPLCDQECTGLPSTYGVDFGADGIDERFATLKGLV